MPADIVDELYLPRTLRIQAGGRTLVLTKRAGESTAHVLMKAIACARYAPEYPDLRIETAIGLRYKPDLVALDDTGAPRLWVECGHVDREKLRRLVRRFPRTHLAWFRRQSQWAGAVRIVRDALVDVRRSAPIDVLAVDDTLFRAVLDTGDADRAASAVTMERFGA